MVPFFLKFNINRFEQANHAITLLVKMLRFSYCTILFLKANYHFFLMCQGVIIL
jgi:hypothetical protein